MSIAEAPRPPEVKKLEEYNSFDPDLMECPFHYWKQLREEAPVFQDPTTGMYLVSNYKLVCDVVRNPTLFSNKFGLSLRNDDSPHQKKLREIAATGYEAVDTMLTADPPEHTRYRKLVNKAFSPKRVAEMDKGIEKIVNEIIDGFIDKGEVELLSEFGQLLPLIVIAEQLGVPVSDRKKFRKWSDSFIAQLSMMADEERQLQAQRDIVEFQHYFAEKLKEKKANPTDDIISDLAHVTLEDEGDPRGLNTAEQLSILQQLLVAGNETTAKSIVEGMYLLITHPDQMKAVYEDYELIPNMIEESLRMLTPTNNMYRVVTDDTELGGVKIPKGSMLMVKYGAANRDTDEFADGEDFDIRRKNARSHLAFGMGIHTCIGNSLARQEMKVGFRVLFDRTKNWRFVEGKNDFRHSPNVLLRGMEKLHLAFDKR